MSNLISSAYKDTVMLEQWKQFKRMLRSIYLNEDALTMSPQVEQFNAGYHMHYKEKHDLIQFGIELESPRVIIPGTRFTAFYVKFSWAICPTCNETRFKKLMALNNIHGTSFEILLHDNKGAR